MPSLISRTKIKKFGRKKGKHSSGPFSNSRVNTGTKISKCVIQSEQDGDMCARNKQLYFITHNTSKPSLGNEHRGIKTTQTQTLPGTQTLTFLTIKDSWQRKVNTKTF